jgi:hypothetical protein
MTSKKNAKNAKIYECIDCDYISSNKTDYSRHLLTVKHLKITNTYKILTNYPEKTQKTPDEFSCKCGKSYKHRQSLYNHEKKCKIDVPKKITIVQQQEKEKEPEYKEMFMMFMNCLQEQSMKQMNMFQTTLMDIIPKINQTTNNVNSHNTNNININVFLNENCKDAISMGDFIKSIEVSVNDLLITKEKGLQTGISNLFIEHLNKIPLVQRPIWCSDKKRKRLFIKNDTWTEDEDNEKTKDAIKQVGVLQSKNINKYTKANPNWMSNDHEKETYMSIIKNTTEQIEGSEDKIIDGMIEQIHLTSDKRQEIVK